MGMPARRCMCTHLLDWHWSVGQTGGVIFTDTGANRCPDWACGCKKPEWDGAEPECIVALT